MITKAEPNYSRGLTARIGQLEPVFECTAEGFAPLLEQDRNAQPERDSASGECLDGGNGGQDSTNSFDVRFTTRDILDL